MYHRHITRWRILGRWVSQDCLRPVRRKREIILEADSACRRVLRASDIVAAPAEADVTHVAVAANFTEPAKEIAALFKQKTGHEAVLIFGASGAFFTQITHGAPFEVFLSADAERPKAAIDGGFAVPDSLFTYAIGKLVLWSRVVDVTNGEAALKAGKFSKLVDRQSGRRALRDRRGRNDEGARRLRRAEAEDRPGQQHRAGVPVRRHKERGGRLRRAVAALRRDRRGRAGRFRRTSMRRSGRTRCCLKTGANSEASKAFLAFLKGPEARAIIEQFGYALE